MWRSVFDIGLELLDHEVVDAAGVPCGVVDDVELAGEAGKPLRVAAVMVGAGAIADRLVWPFNALVRRVFGRDHVRIPWAEVRTVAERITLRDSAQAYGLGAVDRKWGRLIARIPGSS
jgi:sporulation protein YlmC with PRC-barrel domain